MANTSRKQICHMLRNIFRNVRSAYQLSVGTLRLFSETWKDELLLEDRLKIPGKWRLPLRYSSMTAVIFWENIRSTECVVVTSKLWDIKHCDVGTMIGQVWRFYCLSLNYELFIQHSVFKHI